MDGKKTYTLYSYCDANHLATDRCKDETELVETFKDALHYYTGKDADDDIVTAFLEDKEVIIDDGNCEYSFCY